MRCTDLHPEDLIDKELADRLSARERARLDAHVAQCLVCRFERRARDEIRLDACGVPQR